MNKDFLYDKYCVDKLSIRKIANLTNKDPKTISRYLKSYKIPIRQPKNGKNIELGSKFNKLTILKKSNTKLKGRCYNWICQCDCGNIREVEYHYLVSNKIRACKECTRNINAKKLSTGYEEIDGKLIERIKKGAKDRNLSYSLTNQFLWELYIKQNKKCALSNLDIQFAGIGINKKEQTASLDRIDSSKGYTKENVQWVHKDINKIKQDFSEEYLVYLCSLVLERFNQ